MIDRLPRHIAVVMNGNGRWAKERKLPRVAGHRAGLESVKKIAKACGEKGINVLTLFAFGNENWRRPKAEVQHLMDLFFNALDKEIKELHKNKVKLRVIGDRSRFKKTLVKRIDKAERLTENNTGLILVIAVSYSGRWDITTACKRLYEKMSAGELSAESITEEHITANLATSNLPEPDLLIRTSGEQRISNFLLWQLAYTEFYFTETLWPDFDDQAFNDALAFYASRDRRFGYTPEQLELIESA